MEINQTPTPPNEWLYYQTFEPDPETGELVEHRSNFCHQHMATIPDDVPPSDWPQYLYRSCTQAEKDQWEHDHPEPEVSPDETGGGRRGKCRILKIDT